MRRLLPLLLLVACEPALEADRTATIAVDDAVVRTLDPGFLSFAVDSGSAAGTEFWNPDATSPELEIPVDPFDFDQPRLRNLTEALAPAYLRIGGTAADRLWHEVGSPVPDPLPDGYEGFLDEAKIDGIGGFAADTGLDVLFTLNAGPGPRGGDGSEAWDPTHARAVMTHVADAGWPFAVWELGNELNGFLLFHGFRPTPQEYAADLAALADLRDELTPEARVAGPAVLYWAISGELSPFLPTALPLLGEHLDVLTWHFYPQMSERCPLPTVEASPTTLLDPERLDEVLVWLDELQGLAGEHAPGAEQWLAESGNALCGGQPGVSDRYASSLWWLDELGLMATRDQGAVVRQSLAGSNYGLISEVDLAVRPDWMASYAWRRLMGDAVLTATSDDATVRAYAHCRRGVPGEATVLAINLSQTESVELDLGAAGRVEQWVFDGELDSTEVRLGEQPIAPEDDGTPPELSPTLHRQVVLPPTSYGFVAIEAPSCI